MTNRRRHITRINATTSLPLRMATGGMLVTLLVGGAMAENAKKDIHIDNNGHRMQLAALGGTVGQVLDSAGVEVHDDDLVSPPLDSKITGDENITIRSVRHVAVTVDGSTRTLDTTALTVHELVDQLGEVDHKDAISQPQTTAIPVDGMKITVTTPKDITIVDAGASTPHSAVIASTVGQALKKLGVTLSDTDVVTPDVSAKLKNGDTITITRKAVETMTSVDTFDVPAVYVDDPHLDKGKTKVIDPGKPGSRTIVEKVTTTNGRVTGRTVVSNIINIAAQPKKIARGTKPAIAHVPAGSRWDVLAHCESTGTWNINSGNGFSGGLQFTPSTWRAYGGGKYAPVAWQATRDQQIQVAERVLAAQGWGAWPACTAKLGWR